MGDPAPDRIASSLGALDPELSCHLPSRLLTCSKQQGSQVNLKRSTHSTSHMHEMLRRRERTLVPSPWRGTKGTARRARSEAARWLHTADTACRGPPAGRAGHTCASIAAFATQLLDTKSIPTSMALSLCWQASLRQRRVPLLGMHAQVVRAQGRAVRRTSHRRGRAG